MSIEELLRRQSILELTKNKNERQENALFVGDRLRVDLETVNGVVYARAGYECSVEQKYRVEQLVRAGTIYVKN